MIGVAEERQGNSRSREKKRTDLVKSKDEQGEEVIRGRPKG